MCWTIKELNRAIDSCRSNSDSIELIQDACSKLSVHKTVAVGDSCDKSYSYNYSCIREVMQWHISRANNKENFIKTKTHIWVLLWFVIIELI